MSKHPNQHQTQTQTVSVSLDFKLEVDPKVAEYLLDLSLLMGGSPATIIQNLIKHRLGDISKDCLYPTVMEELKLLEDGKRKLEIKKPKIKYYHQK